MKVRFPGEVAISTLIVFFATVSLSLCLFAYLLRKKRDYLHQGGNQQRRNMAESLDLSTRRRGRSRSRVRIAGTGHCDDNGTDHARQRSASLPKRFDTAATSCSSSFDPLYGSGNPGLLRTRSADSLITASTRNSLCASSSPDVFSYERARTQRSRMLVMDLLYNSSLSAQAAAEAQLEVNNDAPPPRYGGWRGQRPPRAFFHRAAPRFHAQRAARDRHFAQEFMRLNYLVAREQALFATHPHPPLHPHPHPPPTTAGEGAVDAELLLALKPIATNDPSCTSYVYDASAESKMQQINAALRQNTVLRQIHLHPCAWKDLKAIKELASIIRQHANLREVHLHPANSTRNFVTQLAVDILMQAFLENTSIIHWCLHLGSNSVATVATISDTMVECIRGAAHLEILELWDVYLPTQSATSLQRKLASAIAEAQPSLHTLKIFRADASTLQSLFQHCASQGSSGLRTLHIESAREAGTEGLEQLVRMPNCRLERLTLKSIQTFQRIHADRLVGGLTVNTSVKHVTFMDCCFHPEVVRPLQDLVKNRLDLESFQITRCNADPSMALLTVCANVYNGKMTCLKSVTMGFSLGIEDRLGGDAIRSVLRYNPNLEVLNLVGSHRLGETGLRHVARGLGKNATLRKLDLSHCSISLPSLRLLTTHIAANLNSRLTCLNLSHNALGFQGVQILTCDWLLQSTCVLQELVLNRCEIYSEAFMALIRAIQHCRSLEVLQVLECGRLGMNELQELGESLFRLGTLRVLKASCFKSPVQMIRPAPHHLGGGPPNLAQDDFVFVDDDDGDEANESDDEDDLDLLLEEDIAEMAAAAAAHNNVSNHSNTNGGSTKLLKETFLAGLIHNHRLEHISLNNILECVLKPKDAMRVRAWMEFCGKRNLMQPLLQQSEIPLLDILTNVVKECRDPRTSSLNATGLSLHYHCLRNRPDALDIVQRMLTVEAKLKARDTND